MSRVVLVCGGRDYSNVSFLENLLDSLHRAQKITTLVHGGAAGADALAAGWAKARGIPIRSFPITDLAYKAYGKAAGPMRNGIMLMAARPQLVVAFPGGKGTADTVRRTKAAGIKLIQIL